MLAHAQRVVSAPLEILDGKLAAAPTLSCPCHKAAGNRNMLNLAFRRVTDETVFASLRGAQREVAWQTLNSSLLSLPEIEQLVGYSQQKIFPTAYRWTFGHASSRELERRAR
ncbi:hypothetical protein [Paracoccus zhejiangensis]|uniref:hypothetical protein n=1 Tax=Paracoccus zhejiangensis TaxID=1077935 RepID=UPI0012FFE709|nr:hypothetical protein [Paracoccus zhejiangensis]